MTRVYLDPSTLVLASAGPGTGDDHVGPGVAEAVAHLVDAGFEVIVLGPADAEALKGLGSSVGHQASLPEHLDGDAWYLTAEPHPTFGRPRGGTTVLVGPRRAAGKMPLPRFDLETRDLGSAAMEILTRQAMT
ncbi:MAG TPA: hypothetical protein VGK16_04845 [Candidatus Limnocylindrales bacterium]